METSPRIRVGRTEMDFPHQGRILTAVHPFYGPANSKTLQGLIRQDRLKEPTSTELASFVHEYFNGSEPQAKDVTKIMKDGYFRGFTGILYVPEGTGKGLAHFIDYPEFDENSYVDTVNLLKRVDESRAQVSFEHLKERVVNWKKVAKDPYFVAWAGGEQGAEKLAELVSKHPRKEAYVFVPNVSDLNEPTARVAGLDSFWGDDGLGVDSGSRGSGRDGCGFGVLKKTSEAGSPKDK